MRERDDLRKQLTEQLAKGDINIDEITSKIVAEKMEEASKKFSEERSTLEGFLQSKIERNLELEMRLDEIKDAYRALEQSLTTDDKKDRQKV